MREQKEGEGDGAKDADDKDGGDEEAAKVDSPLRLTHIVHEDRDGARPSKDLWRNPPWPTFSTVREAIGDEGLVGSDRERRHARTDAGNDGRDHEKRGHAALVRDHLLEEFLVFTHGAAFSPLCLAAFKFEWVVFYKKQMLLICSCVPAKSHF